MKRWLYADRVVVGRPEELRAILRAGAVQLLRHAVGDPDAPFAGDGSLAVRLDSRVAGVPAAKHARVTIGPAFETDRRLRLPLSWYADPHRGAFPTFDGELTLERLSGITAQLTLTGSYRAPGGPAGALADATVLHGVASRTAEGLLAGLGSALTAARPGTDPTPDPEPPSGMRVREVMTADPLTLHEDMPLRTAALLLFHHGISGAPVISDSGQLVGVISERDLLEKEAAPRYGLGRAAAEAQRRRLALTVGQASSRPARTTAADASLQDAARELLDRGVGRLLVLDGADLVGIVTRHDILRALLRTDAELRAAVDEILAELGERRVHASVSWGEVTLTGATRLRSRVPELITRVERLDGVMHVHDDLAWELDDVAPRPLTPPLV